MNRLFSLSADELKQVYILSKNCSVRVRNIIQSELNDAGTEDAAALSVIRDEAFGLYWKMVIDESAMLTEKDVEELLCNERFPTSKSLLGEAIISNKLSVSSCEKVLEKSDFDSWLFKQAKAFILLLSLEESLGELLNLHCMWALYRVVESIDEIGLETFSEMLEANKFLAKKDKNRLSEKIKQRRKQDIHRKKSLRSK